MKQLLPALALGSLAALPARAQSARLHDVRSLAWLVHAGDHQLASQWAVHTEVQLRQLDLVRDPQQELYRLGLVRTLTSRLKVVGGYTFFQRHRYDPCAEVPGQVEPEHRLYEDVTLSNQLGRWGLAQRIRLEQR